MIVQQKEKIEAELKADIKVELKQYKQSDFKQVVATFFTHQSKELVFRVLSNIDQTQKWLERVKVVEVLEIYNNQHYLLRTVISTPWPFKDRELITCVETTFNELITTINIMSCSERVPIDTLYLRLPQVESSWKIRKITNSLVKVEYQTWLDPAGNIPVFIFNNELIESTQADLKKLQRIIEDASLEQFAY
jgi:hypothetical protein